MIKNITRREIIKAAPALTAIPAVAMASGTPEDQTFALIEAHRVALETHNEACAACDSVALGRAATAEEWAAEEEANDDEIEAATALAEYAPTSIAASRAKAEYITAQISRGSFDNQDTVAALMRASAQMVRA
ncbi:hypothetical protein [Amaricoccus solimangrovi]|uniref:Uncharacterized protein n=1 Tax=Amaricoccus solimangrovi TaxID=2589815 RepID=A0A501WY74_9RHOB|nr:hypothetical protein [Amaricoccus solimangrovi]TPE53215.1 hypothetical protein FJM51_04130 [Amaricoccus solimangrovi]